MATVGGGSDKLGNAYETLWTIDQLLQLVSGEALALRLEPLDRWEAQGIEFQVKRPNGTLEFWSSKRQQASASGWTLDKLTKPEKNGRSILGDLLIHIERSSENRGVFVSMHGAPKLSELCDYAHDGAMHQARLQLSGKLETDFKKYVRDTLCNGDEKRAFRFLQCIRVSTIDENELRKKVYWAVRTLLYSVDTQVTDPEAIYGHLEAFLHRTIHQWIDQARLLSELEQHNVRRRDWAVDTLVSDQIATLCDGYTRPVHLGLINGIHLENVQIDALAPLAHSATRKVVVVAEAGSGKTCALGTAIQKLRENGIPVMPIRFDQLSEGILSTRELGQKLGLPESPAIVLAGVARGGRCALVIDQLDAISMASGRRTELWSLFDALRREAERYPNMSIMVACRVFDLENDHRIRELLNKEAGFTKVELKLLTLEQIDGALVKAGIEPARVPPKVKTLLSLPLHLWMYLSLPADPRTTIHSREQLFELFWTQKEQNARQRAGRKIEWFRIIETLSEWLSNNQQLSAPGEILDEYPGDAEILISEHVLTKSEGRYRFFHESFFDYAFARSFVRREQNLVAWLGRDEQHLFRRAQVRQILTYLRMRSRHRYLEELEALLSSDKIRFHLQRFITYWLASLADPDEAELRVLDQIATLRPELRSDIAWIGAGNVAWFDLRDRQGFYVAELSSGDAERERRAITLLSIDSLLTARADRIVQIVRQTRKPTGVWHRYLYDFFSSWRTCRERPMFDLLIETIREKSMIDSAESSFNWSGLLYGLSKNSPEYACEVIAYWYDREIEVWRQAGAGGEHVLPFSRRNIDPFHVVETAKGAAEGFVQVILPRVAARVAELARGVGEFLDVDPIWSSRAFGADPYDFRSAILVGLAEAMELMAKNSPNALRSCLDQYLARPHNTMAYLMLRAWAAGGDHYADDIADYLVADARRLRVGYSMGGSASYYVSCRAIEVASPHCSDARHAALEKAILGLKPSWETKYPQRRGITQLELLSCMDRMRFTAAGRVVWGALITKFPQYRRTEPKSMHFETVGSPLEEKAYAEMTDKQWLRAMRRYAGVHSRDIMGMTGGERELAGALEQQAKLAPLRFIRLANRMPDTFPSSYFGAIVRGVTDIARTQKDAAEPLAMVDICGLIRRVHELPGRPCGHWLSWLMKKWNDTNWPDDVLRALCWYALHDADPKAALWRKTDEGRPVYYGGDPYMAGINSTRGAAAGAIAHVLFDHPERFEFLRPAIESLVQDPSLAVRACAIDILYAMLKEKRSTAIQWFNDLVKNCADALPTPLMMQFIHYAGYHDYLAMRQTILAMLNESDIELVKAAAEQVCVLSLRREIPVEDIDRVRCGTDVMREATAGVYAANVTEKKIGSICRELVVPFFSDPAASVRKAAAHALTQLAALDTAEQAKLLCAFLDANPGVEEFERVMWQLEESPVQLPDLVCRLGETCLRHVRATGEDGSRTGLSAVYHLPKIVVRLYAQTADKQIQKRCLDMIDTMEREKLMGIHEVLSAHDR